MWLRLWRWWWHAPGKPSQLHAEPSRRTLTWLLAAVFLLTAVPRLIVALQALPVCNDAYYYIWTAQMLEQGRYELGLRYININIYPMILIALQRLGMEPVTAGRVWGFAISTLTVFPLFALVRRLFDIRVASAACVLFAVHPSLVEISSEPLREPTFLFLFVAALWSMHVAAENGTWRWAALSGILLALSVHTRMEGWVLLIPSAWWFLRNGRDRWSIGNRLLRFAGVTSMVPAFVVLVNVTFLADHSRWEWGRMGPIQRIIASLAPQPAKAEASTSAGSHSASAGSQTSTAQTAAVPKSPSRRLSRIKHYLQEAGEEFEYLNLLLLLAGMLLLRGQVCRGDNCPLTIMFAGLMAAVWVRMGIAEINGRYFLTAWVVSLPTAAVGAVGVCSGLKTWIERRSWRPFLRRIGVALPVAFFLTFNLIGSMRGSHTSRVAEASLGEWLRRNHGPFRHVEVDQYSARVGYYARHEMPAVGYFGPVEEDTQNPPDLLIVQEPVPAVYRKRAQRFAMTKLTDALPTSMSDKFAVFVPGKGSRPQAIARKTVAGRH